MKRREPTRALRFGRSHPSRQRQGVSLALVGVLLLTWTCQPALAAKVQLLEGTKIRVELAEDLSSRRARLGDEVRYYVMGDVLGPNKEVLIRNGARAIGRIVSARSAGGLGKQGKLELTIDWVEAVDGTKVPLLRRGRKWVAGANQGDIVVATLIWVSRLGVFIKGRNVTVREGTLFDVRVDQTLEIEVGGTSPPTALQDKGLLSVLTLVNGDKVTGTFIELKDGALMVKSELGAVRIPVDRINTLTPKDDNSSAPPPDFVIEKKNGEKVTGKVKGLKEKVFTIETAEGTVTIPVAEMITMGIAEEGK